MLLTGTGTVAIRDWRGLPGRIPGRAEAGSSEFPFKWENNGNFDVLASPIGISTPVEASQIKHLQEKFPSPRKWEFPIEQRAN